MRITGKQMSYRSKKEQRKMLLRRTNFSKTDPDRVAWSLTVPQ